MKRKKIKPHTLKTIEEAIKNYDKMGAKNSINAIIDKLKEDEDKDEKR